MTTKPICIKISSPEALSLVKRLCEQKKETQKELQSKKELYFPSQKQK